MPSDGSKGACISSVIVCSRLEMDLSADFEERRQEIDAYLELLEGIDAAVQLAAQGLATARSQPSSKEYSAPQCISSSITSSS